MLGLISGALPWAKIALVGVVVAAAVGLWLYIGHLNSTIDDLHAMNGALTVKNQVQDETISSLEGAVEEWAAHAEALRQTNEAMARAQTEATAEQRKLNDVLARHDLTALSVAKPGLLERRINSGTARILGMFECSSGGGTDCAGGGSEAGE